VGEFPLGRAGQEVARGVASLAKGTAVAGEARLAFNPFAARCLRHYHLDGVLRRGQPA
jgi:hypothetical protein